MKNSTLPPVLQQYSPEYSQGTPVVHNSPAPEQHKAEQAQEQHGKRKRSGMGSRERTSEMLKRQETERHKEVYETYHQVKQELREEGTEKLKEKIRLQQSLIRTQDQLHEVLEDERKEREEKKRNEEKAARRSKNAELEAICKQSLEEDRLAARQSSRQDSAKTIDSVASSPTKHPHHPLPKLSTSAPTSANRQAPGGGGGGPPRLPTYITENSNASSNVHPAALVAPLPEHSGYEPGAPGGHDDLIEEEDEEVEAVASRGSLPGSRPATNSHGSAEKNYDELPWHHIQLYEMYGAEADYFLYPKMQAEKKTIAKPLSYNRLNDLSGGQMGAKELWGHLRGESIQRLIHEDSMIPQELKHTYGAFVRQLLSQRKHAVKRNFYQQEDVPEMARLMDRTKMASAHKYRHQMELMFRSSVMNEDKCRVLMYNNPMPDLNNFTGEESVRRYIPDGLEEGAGDADMDAESLNSFKKWLQQSKEKAAATQTSPLPIEGSEKLSTDISQKAAPPTLPQRRRHRGDSYLLLTEENNRPAGQFTARYKAAGEAKLIPAPAFDHKHQSQQTVSQSVPKPGSVASSVSSTRSLRRRGGGWQPLTMTALQAYHKRRDCPGSGGFNLGRSPMWSVQ